MSSSSLPISRVRRRRGFTLIEILVASAVMALLVGIVVLITSEVLRVWNRSAGRLSANQEARVALELLTQDLETAVFRNDGNQWLLLENESFDGPAGAVTNTVRIRLFSPALDRPAGPGDICGISYELNFRNPATGAAPTVTSDANFALYRRVNTPSVTFVNLMGDGNQETLSGNPNWQVDYRDDYLVSNIVEFRVDVYAEDPSDVSGISLVSGPVLFGGTGATVGRDSDPFLPRAVFADIRLRVLSSEGANILTGLRTQSGDGTVQPAEFERVIREHSSTYTRRVTFMNRPF